MCAAPSRRSSARSLAPRTCGSSRTCRRLDRARLRSGISNFTKNQSQGEIYMAGWMEHGLNSGSEGVSSGLEDGAAAALDFVRSVDQTPAERADLLADLSPD